MKKLLSLLLTVALTLLMMVFPVLAYSDYGLVYDETDLLDSDVCESAAETLKNLTDRYYLEFRVGVVTTLEGYEINDYAEVFYNQFEYGYGDSQNGVLLMLYLSEDSTGLEIEQYIVYGGGVDSDNTEILAYYIDLAIAEYVDSTAWEGDIQEDNETFENLISAYAEAVESYFDEEPSDDVYLICDLAEILTIDELESLEEQASQIAKDYDCSVCVVTVEDYLDYAYSMEDLCDKYHESIVSETNQEDAIILALSMDERDYWLKDYGEIPRDAVTDYGHDQLKESFLDNFKNDDWAGGFADYLAKASDILEAAKNGTPLDKSIISRILPAYGIGLLAAVIIAFIICGVFKSQMKTAVKATSADTYVTPGGVDIHIRQDNYTHTTRTKRKIESSNNSSGGGGGNHSSGGKF